MTRGLNMNKMGDASKSKSLMVCRTKQETTTLNLNWEIENFHQLFPRTLLVAPTAEAVKTLDKLLSPQFDLNVGTLTSKVRAEVDCTLEDGKVHLSLYLRLLEAKDGAGPLKPLRVSSAMSTYKLDGSVSFKCAGIWSCKGPSTEEYSLAEKNSWGYPTFLSLEKIYADKKKYLERDTLRLNFHLTAYDGKPETTCQVPGASKVGAEGDGLAQLKADFGSLLTSGDGSDFKIECGGKTFPVHSAILSARSNVFGAMLSHGDMLESQTKTLKIADMTPGVLKFFLHYIYTSELDSRLGTETLEDLVRAAGKYGILPLKTLCFQTWLQRINNENAGPLAVLAYQYSPEESIVAEIKAYCQSNWSELISLPDFTTLLTQHLDAFLALMKK